MARRSRAAAAARDPAARAAVPTPASAALPRVWQGIGYQPLPEPGAARALFEFAALPWPAGRDLALAWGALEGAGRLVGALVGERSGSAMMLHGPVVTAADAPIEIAAQLLAAALDQATAAGVATVFARPQGLDRVWVRFGFIPVPESTLPAPLGVRAGGGLYAWRGGSALWTLRESETA